jgi:hypothetical protein
LLDERWVETEELRLTELPVRGFERPGVVRRFLQDCVQAIEQEARRVHHTVMGVRRVCAQPPQDRPSRPERSPAPLCHTTIPRLREKYMEGYRSFTTVYRPASVAWRRGDLSAVFPPMAVRPFVWPIQPTLAEAA